MKSMKVVKTAPTLPHPNLPPSRRGKETKGLVAVAAVEASSRVASGARVLCCDGVRLHNCSLLVRRLTLSPIDLRSPLPGWREGVGTRNIHAELLVLGGGGACVRLPSEQQVGSVTREPFGFLGEKGNAPRCLGDLRLVALLLDRFPRHGGGRRTPTASPLRRSIPANRRPLSPPQMVGGGGNEKHPR